MNYFPMINKLVSEGCPDMTFLNLSKGKFVSAIDESTALAMYNDRNTYQMITGYITEGTKEILELGSVINSGRRGFQKFVTEFHTYDWADKRKSLRSRPEQVAGVPDLEYTLCALFAAEMCFLYHLGMVDWCFDPIYILKRRKRLNSPVGDKKSAIAEYFNIEATANVFNRV